MNAWLRRGAALATMIVLLSCGGGGGEGGGGIQTELSAKALPEYLGTFEGACEPADDVVVAATGSPVHVRSYLVLDQPSGNVAHVALRLAFHADASCAAHPLAYLVFDDPGNQVVFEDARSVDGRTAHRVTLSLAAAQGGTPVAGGRVEFGATIRLSAPAPLFSSLLMKDLWLSDGAQLFQGVLAPGPDGFPTTLDLDVANVRVAAASPMSDR